MLLTKHSKKLSSKSPPHPVNSKPIKLASGASRSNQLHTQPTNQSHKSPETPPTENINPLE